jgi:hypothetical protein
MSFFNSAIKLEALSSLTVMKPGSSIWIPNPLQTFLKSAMKLSASWSSYLPLEV